MVSALEKLGEVVIDESVPTGTVTITTREHKTGDVILRNHSARNWRRWIKKMEAKAND